MKEKINIAEILKDCPSGMALDCVMYDNVSFDKVSYDKKTVYPILCYITDENGNRSSISFTENGYESKRYGAKCVIFPKGKTTWEGFQRPFKDGDVLAYKFPYYTNPSIYIHKYHQNLNTAYYVALSGSGDFMVSDKHTKALYGNDSSVRFATEEERQKLFDAIKANGYKWNPETKTLEKLCPFNAGDVLVSGAWNIVLFSHIDDEQVIYYHCILEARGSFWIVEGTSCGVGKVSNCKLATEEQRNKLFDRLQKSGYKYNPQTNKLEKFIVPKFKVGDRVRLKSKPNYRCTIYSLIWDDNKKLAYNLLPDNDKHLRLLTLNAQDDYELVPNKFDISTLVPFESKVLVREDKTDVWRPTFYGTFNQHNKRFYTITSATWRMCIPYNKDTKHLIGTTNDCEDFYKTW